MKHLKRAGLFLLDFVEVYMPMAALTITFGAFIVNVVSRYVFNSPVNESYELCLAGLLWCLLLSAPYATRRQGHVCFTLLYDKVDEPVRLAFRLIGSAFLLACFLVMAYPCADWVMFMARKRTAILKIRMDIIYSPFIAFTGLTIAHLIYDLVKDLIILVKAVTGKAPLTPKEP